MRSIDIVKATACAVLLALGGGITAPARAALNEEAKLADASLAAGAASGSAVAMSNGTAVVGAPAENGGAGAAYVFVLTPPSSWSLQQKLVASDTAANQNFGASVSISGDRIAVGAPGRASNRGGLYTFSRAAGVWTQGTPLQSSDGAAGDKFGSAVSIAGTTLAAGAPFHAVGAKLEAGQGYIFRLNTATQVWAQFSILQNSNGQTKAGDHLGAAVSLSGNTALVGMPDQDAGGNVDSGGVTVFVANTKKWTRQATLNPGTAAGDRFGAALSLFTNTAIIGAPLANVGANADQGRAYVFNRAGNTWTAAPIALVATDGAAGDRFGASVAVAGAFAAIGAPIATSTAGAGGGKGYLFSNTGAGFTPVDSLVATTNAAGDALGTSAAVDSGRALLGAPGVDLPQADGGAAYTFVFAQPTTTSITLITPEPTLTGQSYDVSVTVTAGSGVPIGGVVVDDGDGSTCTIAALSLAGSGTCTLTSTSGGAHTITASYAGTLIFGASQGTATHMVTLPDTTTAITGHAPTSSVVGQAVTVTVVVNVVPPGNGAPTGVVTVMDGAAVFCSVVDVSVDPTCIGAFPTVGTHTLTATYLSDGDYNGSSTTSGTSHVVTIAQTTTTTSSSQNPSVINQSVNIIATVTGTPPGAGPPAGAACTGTVDFYEGATLIAPAVSIGANCVAMVSRVFAAAGTVQFHTVYSGDANYAGSTSPDFTQTTVLVDAIFKDGFE